MSVGCVRLFIRSLAFLGPRISLTRLEIPAHFQWTINRKQHMVNRRVVSREISAGKLFQSFRKFPEN